MDEVFNVLDFFFFFKQKTAYEMRISDWSSDVCSSDLRKIRSLWNETKGSYDEKVHDCNRRAGLDLGSGTGTIARQWPADWRARIGARHQQHDLAPDRYPAHRHRSEDRRAGKEWVSPCITRGSPAQ